MAGTDARHQLGRHGETLAANHLRRSGYQVVSTNWHCRYGEIDIVARQDDTWVFVEVRTRRASLSESAFASITPHKQERMVRAAQSYLADNDLDSAPWRLDVVAVTIPQNGETLIEHVADALNW